MKAYGVNEDVIYFLEATHPIQGYVYPRVLIRGYVSEAAYPRLPTRGYLSEATYPRLPTRGYLSGRMQRVEIGDTFSELGAATKGVPPGSALGSIFTIYLFLILMTCSST